MVNIRIKVYIYITNLSYMFGLTLSKPSEDGSDRVSVHDLATDLMWAPLPQAESAWLVYLIS